MRLPQLTFGRVLAGTAVVLVLTTGTAYAANTVGSGDIINGSIQTVDIKNDAITAAKIAPNAVGSSEISGNAVKTADILNDTIKTADVKNGTLTGVDVADGTLASADILDATLTAADLASNSVGFDEIQTDAVQATEIADNSIDSGEIVDFGLTNQDVGVLFAQVNSDGTLANSSGSVISGRVGATGSYEVDFARNITACAFVATVGPAGGGSALGEVNVADRSGNAEAVFVDTNNSDGSTADKPFSLIVVC